MQSFTKKISRHIALWTFLLLALWVISAWYITQLNFAHKLDVVVEEEQLKAQETSADVADSVLRNLHYVAGIPEMMQQGLMVRQAVVNFGPKTNPQKSIPGRATEEPSLRELSRYLELSAKRRLR